MDMIAEILKRKQRVGDDIPTTVYNIVKEIVQYDKLSKTEKFETLINLLKRVKNIVKDTKGLKTTNEKYYLREDDKGRWKILFWELTYKTF